MFVERLLPGARKRLITIANDTPLIEAAKCERPIIARDIPVFREIAGEHAYFFSGMGLGAAATMIGTRC